MRETERGQRIAASGALVSFDKSDSICIALLGIFVKLVFICMILVFASFFFCVSRFGNKHADETSRESTDHSLPSRVLRVGYESAFDS
jgi:hypothetical protein